MNMIELTGVSAGMGALNLAKNLRRVNEMGMMRNLKAGVKAGVKAFKKEKKKNPWKQDITKSTIWGKDITGVDKYLSK